MRALDNLVVVITGASQGIGAAIARNFALHNARVVVTGRNRARLAENVAPYNIPRSRYLIIAGDLTHPGTVKKIVSAAVKKFGRIDIFVNNAGVGIHKPVEETTVAEYDTIMDTNLKAIFLSFRELIPLFRRQGGGQIINISSGAARIGSPGLAVYAASKAAVNVLSESAAGEVRNQSIKISVLSPASTDTKLMSQMSKQSRSPSKASLKLTVDEVAEAVIYLARQNSNAWTSMADIRPLLINR
ncbi:Short-chain dehydrogenase/reductase SDR [Candidatus Zixiibacteriota bacterium]|nr:Short-chain dehydrogenase/reductase SDR [candidate division Zixibacteria bacterium]